MSTLAEEYPKEQGRIRELLSRYREIGPAGIFGAAVIEQTLREADEAAMSEDLVRMLRAFESMKECK